ncbi:MAG: hypothetical protein CSB47_01680 [Proteobacteria bacterium]|nr:MAG: hypothetical protein CSB47_01680 [Pseudomonadota bacterium]
MFAYMKLGIRQLGMGIGLFCLSLPVMASEYRCGWIENPGPGRWWITDKDASWEISTPGGYSVSPQSIDQLPDIIPNGYVRVTGTYGYSCGCLTVSTDKRKHRITKVHTKGKQQLLKRCLEDRSITNKNGKRVSKRMNPAVQRSVAAPTQVVLNHVQQPRRTPHTAQVSQPNHRQAVVRQPPRNKPVVEPAYYIQVITTSDHSKANSLKNSFAKDGFETVVTSAGRDGKKLYRVNFGPFANKGLAAQAQATLKGIFAGNANVQESILVSKKPAVSVN